MKRVVRRTTFEMEKEGELGRGGKWGWRKWEGFGIWVLILYLESCVLFLYHVFPLGWRERKENGTDIAS